MSDNDDREERLEIITNTRFALIKEDTRHINIRANLVGDYLYNNKLAVIDVGTNDQGSRFMVPKNKAEQLVKVMNEVLCPSYK